MIKQTDRAIEWFLGSLVAFLLGLAVIVTFALALGYNSPAKARDLGQWKDSDQHIASWFKSLMQPDNPNVPCCSFADAYYADKIRVAGNKVFATITDDRPDEPLGRPHIPVGTEFEIPPNKLKWDKGNPVGRNILFVGAGGVYCFVQSTGI